MPEVQAVKAKGAPLEAGPGSRIPCFRLQGIPAAGIHRYGWGRRPGQKAGGALPLIQGAMPIGQLPSAGCCLMMGRSVLGGGDLDQQTFPGEGDGISVSSTTLGVTVMVELSCGFVVTHDPHPLEFQYVRTMPPPPPHGAWLIAGEAPSIRSRDRGL